MTEKRFTLETFTVDCYVENLYVVVDNEKEMTEYQRHQQLTENEVVELLNAQHEEIQQSKVLIKKYHNENTDLIKENEQLKKENEKLRQKKPVENIYKVF